MTILRGLGGVWGGSNGPDFAPKNGFFDPYSFITRIPALFFTEKTGFFGPRGGAPGTFQFYLVINTVNPKLRFLGGPVQRADPLFLAIFVVIKPPYFPYFHVFARTCF